MLKLFAPVLVCLTFIGLVLSGLLWYLNLPQVGINSEGHCAWVQYQDMREACPEVLPRKYIEVKVK